MAVSLSYIVRVLPGVLKASGSALDLNGLILTDNTRMPAGQVLSFTTAEDVSAYFGSETVEAEMAPWYFNGYNNSSRTPGELLFARFNTASAVAFLRSGSLASMTLEELATLGGTMTLSVNGSEVTSENVDLSDVTSFAEAAGRIADAINGDSAAVVSVTFDTTAKAMVISCLTPGADSTMTYASGTLADELLLTQTGGATLSQGVGPDVVSDLMTSVLEQNQNWATFTTAFMPTAGQVLDFAKWTNAQSLRFAYVMLDDSTAAITNGSTDALATPIISAEYAGVVPVYGRQDHGAGVMGYAGALNFNQRNGRRNLAFRVQSGLEVMVTKNTEYSALMANGYNFYGKYAQNKITTNQWYPGSVTGDYKWLDSYLGQMWLNAQLQGDIITLFQSEVYLPYAADGRAAIETAMLSTIELFKEWGGISPGTKLGDSQLIAIKNATGMDPTSVLNSKGYLIYIGEFTATMRAERTSPEVYLWYCDGGFIQQLYINSIEVQ
jgi:Protein of unknown function (DUF3383).